jgi:POT family proton-dependent oligopeptide transporter
MAMMLSNYQLSSQQLQIKNVALITFWAQFAAAAQYAILVLFLTRPLSAHGLGFSQAEAYTFFGVCQAIGYLTPLLGGYMADNVLGLRRSILLGSILLACAYLLITLSGFVLPTQGRAYFIAAYACIPAANSLVMGTTASMVSKIYADKVVEAKIAMTLYYMSINVGGLLAYLIAPSLLNSAYGPLSVFAVAFVGKSLSAYNFMRKYDLYDNVRSNKDKQPWTSATLMRLVLYWVLIYLGTLSAYHYRHMASIVISLGCGIGLFWFLVKTHALSGVARSKQTVALILILEAVVFFVIYNQMHTTLILFAQSNSDNLFLGFKLSPAHYQLLNPLLIIVLGASLPKLYRRFPKFTVPYQFASGVLLAGLALLFMAYATQTAHAGLIAAKYLGFTYILITLAELCVSTVGLSMIGLYCEKSYLAFAMGVWLLASSLANTVSARIAVFVAIPANRSMPLESLPLYQQYYLYVGLTAVLLGCLMLLFAYYLQTFFARRGIVLD